MEQTVNQAIMECKAGKNREGNLNWIIQKFQPVICKYAGKLYSLEYEDAVQELNEALIMAVVSIDVCNAEGQSIAYAACVLTNPFPASSFSKSCIFFRIQRTV